MHSQVTRHRNLSGVHMEPQIIDLELMQQTMGSCFRSYENKPDSLTDSEWLKEVLKKGLPDHSQDQIDQSVSEITAFHASYNENYKSIRTARERGMGADEWFARKLQDATQGKSNIDTAAFYSRIDTAIDEANQLTESVIRCKDGSVNQSLNLDGFIAESEQVNSFNLDVAIKDNQSVKAEVLQPTEGQTYGKNSVDIQIKKDGKVIRRYQAKYGKDKNSTEKLFEKGDYRGQRKLVPDGHEVEGKSTSTIEADGIRSKPLTKEKAKELQRKAQEESSIVEKSWDDFDLHQLAKGVGRKAGYAGLLGATVGGISSVAQSVFNDEAVETDEIAMEMVKAGTAASSTVAVSAGIKLMVEKKKLPFMSNTMIASSATNAVGAVSTAYKLAVGEIDAEEAIDEVIDRGCTTCCSTACAGYGAAIGSSIPVIGTVVGGCIGGLVGGLAGSTVGSVVAEGAKSIAKAASSIVYSVKDGISNVASSVCNTISSAVGALFSCF